MDKVRVIKNLRLASDTELMTCNEILISEIIIISTFCSKCIYMRNIMYSSELHTFLLPILVTS